MQANNAPGRKRDDTKKALPKQSLYHSKRITRLDGNHVIRTWTFFTLPNVIRDLLILIKAGIALCSNLRIVDEQISRSVFRSDETKSLAGVKPLYCTCTHCFTPWPALDRFTVPLELVSWKDIFER